MVTSLQIRELFHFLFLEQLLKTTSPRLYILKGGVNLRFFFKSPRYSEDIDLDVMKTSVETLKKNGYKILNAAPFRRTLSTYGIESLKINDPLKAKHTETTQRFKVQLHLTSGEVFPTKIEFSRRGNKDPQNFEIARIDSSIAIVYQRLPFLFQHYTAFAAMAQKIEALAQRNVTQVRDLFDLYILKIQLQHFEKLKVPKKIIRDALSNLEALSFDDFQGHVVHFLDLEHQKQFGNKDQWNIILSEISIFLKSI